MTPSKMYEVDYRKCPVDLVEGLKRYVDGGIPTGGFLRAVLENDFQQAARRADLMNERKLRQLAYFLDELPPACWGSKAKVEAWIELHSRARGE